MSDERKGLDVLAVILDVGLMLENSAVFQSQVGEQLLALQGLGYSTGLAAVSRDTEAFERVIGKRLRKAGVRVYTVPGGSFARDLWRMSRLLRRLKTEAFPRVAYVRGLWGPVVLALASPFGRIPHVYDVRGAVADEARAVGTAGFKLAIYLALEAWGIRAARGVTAVTSYLAEATRRRLGKAPIEVVPCNVTLSDFSVSPEEAGRRRAELGFEPSDLVLVYSGGLSHYQQVPAMLSLWRGLLDLPDVRFLMLTNEDPHSKPLIVGDLADFGGRLRCLSLPRAQVFAALAASDAGFMLRDGRELNRAASPVKFAEYLASGLAVAASPGTGDVGRDVEEYRVGVLVDPLRLEEGAARVRALLDMLRADRAAVRARSRALAASRYDWRAYAPAYRRLYGEPSGAPGKEIG